MRALLVDHDEILRDVIEQRRGHLFKHTGDGVAAVFPSPSDAVDAAVDAQQRLVEVLPKDPVGPGPSPMCSSGSLGGGCWSVLTRSVSLPASSDPVSGSPSRHV